MKRDHDRPPARNRAGSRGRGAVLSLCFALVAEEAQSQDSTIGLNTYAVPGLVDMPSAGTFERDDLSYSLTVFRNTIRHGISFQLTNRLTFGLRYNLSYFPGPDGELFAEEDNFDRSFGFHYRLLDEGRNFPAVSVGINDILGTGRFESEYLVATKTLPAGVSVTGGLGWGRLAGVGAFANPLGDLIPALNDREGLGEDNTIGEFNSPQWFQGDAALFGGVTWQANPKLRLAFEISSDNYPLEDGRAFDYREPYNLGLQYKLSDRSTVGAAWLYGSELALQFNYQLNPGKPRNPSGLEPGGPPIAPRPAGFAAAATWSPDQNAMTGMRRQTRVHLDGQGIALHGFGVTGTTARVEIENRDFHQSAQALGRTARVLTSTLPPEIDRFDIVLVEAGLPISSSTIRRDDLARFEFAQDGAWDMQSHTRRADAGPGTQPLAALYPRYTWGIDPYIAPAFFDPDAPLRFDAGLDLSAGLDLRPGLGVSGVLRFPLAGNLDQSTRASTSVLPRVRSESYLYDKAGTTIERLTGAWNFRPGENLYGRVTAGLLEPQYAGVSSEVLWYPIDARLAFGVEVANVRQRGFDQQFDLRDYEVTTGHVSAYWDIGNGFHSQLDVGRYLAGDYGATLTFQREFENGWSLGAFATLTDVSFDDFGEGSFDKGVTLSIPIGWFTGRQTRDTSDFVLRPVLRDGGARLNLDGRLYRTVKDATSAELADGWGRFYR